MPLPSLTPATVSTAACSAGCIASWQWWLTLLCVGVFGVVVALMVWSLWHHRRTAKVLSAGLFHASWWEELLWALVPLLIVGAMAWPAVHVVLAAAQ